MSRNLGSRSTATTWPAIAVSGAVNQPSPQQRSITSKPRSMPMVASTPAGSGHSTGHQPAVGISVPWKNAARSLTPLLPARLLALLGFALQGPFDCRAGRASMAVEHDLLRLARRAVAKIDAFGEVHHRTRHLQ